MNKIKTADKLLKTLDFFAENDISYEIEYNNSNPRVYIRVFSRDELEEAVEVLNTEREEVVNE